jgi:hypothetical protein
MTIGTILSFKSSGYQSDRYYGWLLDDVHRFPDRGHNTYFDERGLDCDLSEIKRGLRVEFEYGEQPPDPEKRPKAMKIKPI